MKSRNLDDTSRKSVECIIQIISQLIILTLASWMHIRKSLLTGGKLNTFFYLTLLDSSFVAWAFVLSYTFKGEKIPDKKPYRDELSYFVRVVVYFLIFTVEMLLNFSFWDPVIKRSEYLLIIIQIITCPIFFNRLYEICDVIKVISYRVRKIQQKIVKKLTCIFMTKILNTVCEKSLKMTCNIHYKELYPLVSDPNTFSDNCQMLLKSLFISIILKEAKSRSNIITDKIIKYIYSYNTGEKLKSYKDKESAKKMCIIIFNNREWNKLIKPNNLYAVLYLFENDTDFDLTFIKDEVKFIIVKVLTVWSISQFFNNNMLAIAVSTLFMIYRDFTKTRILILSIRILSSGLGMYYQSGLLSSVISELVGFLFVYYKSENRLLLISYKQFLNYMWGMALVTYKNKRYTLHIISTIIYTSLPKYISFFEKETVIIMIYAGATFFILLNTQDMIQFFTIIYIISISYLTKCNSLHTIYNGVIVYMLINIWDYIKTEKTKLLDNNMIVSYISYKDEDKYKGRLSSGTIQTNEKKPIMFGVIKESIINEDFSETIRPKINLDDSIKEDYLN